MKSTLGFFQRSCEVKWLRQLRRPCGIHTSLTSLLRRAFTGTLTPECRPLVRLSCCPHAEPRGGDMGEGRRHQRVLWCAG